MTQTKRIAAIASAFTIALLSGTAAVYANQKERIGIDNVDMCQPAIRDPECTNDEAMADDDDLTYGYAEERFTYFDDDDDNVEDEANEMRRRTEYLNDDGIADSQ